MTEILTKSNKSGREATVDMPECLEVETLEDMVTCIGSDMALNKIKAQLTVDFRSHIRSILESESDGEATNSDEAIAEMDFDDWKPSGRVRKTAEEKAKDLLGKLDPDVLKSVLASLED